MAGTWLPIQYREFWDVPRLIVVDTGDRRLLLDCSFDDALDEYPPDYKVFDLPVSSLESISGKDWSALSNQGTFVGQIPVADITLDDSKRGAILATSIQRFLGI